MKKTFNINIGGFVFTIDDDAYELLNNYIDTLQEAFRHQTEGREIVNDIESRIAELFQEKISGGQMVITLSDTEEIINRIGQPEDIISISEEIEENRDPVTGETIDTETISLNDTPQGTVPPVEPGRVNKKLFRDPQMGILGGVCAGLGEYLNVDIALIRLLMVISIFISLSITAFIYVLLWIILPEVKTPYDRMQLQGEQPTIQNIGEKVTGSFRNGVDSVSNEIRQKGPGFWSGLVKVFVVIFLIIAFPVIFALGLSLLGCLFALIMFVVASISGGSALASDLIFGGESNYRVVIYGLLTAIGFILVFGVPIFALIRMMMLRNRESMSSGWKWALVVTWIIGFILAGVFTGFIVKNDYEFNGDKIWNGKKGIFQIERYDDNDEISSETGIYEIPTSEEDINSTDTVILTTSVSDDSVSAKIIKK